MRDITSNIIGIGSFVPPKIVTNDEIAQTMNTSDEFIVRRTGIKTRHHASPDTSTSDLALEASLRAIENAGITPGDIDLILLNTITPDHHDPGTSYFLQAKLRLNSCAAIDLRGQCAGFVYGLTIANQFIRTGTYRNVLVVGAEMLSKRIDTSDDGRNMGILLGDGAGAAVVSNASGGYRIAHSLLGANGMLAKQCWTQAPGTSNGHDFLNKNDIKSGLFNFRMNGPVIFENAVKKLCETASRLLEEQNCTLEDIDWIIPHQPNLRILEAVSDQLNIPDGKMLINVEDKGNTASASIPIMMNEAIKDGKIQPANKIMLLTFGGGVVWGGMILHAA